MIWVLKAILEGGLPIIAFAHVHSAKMKPDQILNVKTALGIATIIEAPEVIQSAIVGDQSGFKIEYIDKAVTIKPLRQGARTNLYLQTASRRFNLKLQSGGQENADYVVYLKPTDIHIPVVWRDVNLIGPGKRLSIKCGRIAALTPDTVLLDLRLSAKEKIKISPENVWIKQGTESKIINGLFLSKLEIAENRPALLGVTLLKSDLARNKAIEVSVKDGNETVALTIRPEYLWK